MTTLAGLLAANLVLAVLGAGVLMATGSWDRLPRWSRVGPALLVGLASAAAVLPPLLYVGVAPTPLVVGTLAFAGLALGALARGGRARDAADPSGGGFVTAAIIGALIAPFALRAAFESIVKFDAYADWSLKARLIYGHGGLLLGAFDPSALSGLYAAGHREYPLGLPTVEAFTFHMAGGDGARVIHLQALLIFVAFLATAWSMLRPRVDPAILGASLCLLVVAPGLHSQILSTYADVPVASMWALAAISLGLFVAGDGSDRLGLATVLAAGALATKQEGIVLDAALYAVAVVCVCAGADRHRLRGLLLSAAIVAASAVPWQLRVRTLGLHDSDIAPSASRMVRQVHSLPTITHRLAEELLGTRWPAIVPLAVAAALWLLVRRRDSQAAVFLALLAATAIGLTGIYWNARIPVSPLLVESAERVVIGPVFLAALSLPLLLSRLVHERAAQLPRSVRARARGARRAG